MGIFATGFTKSVYMMKLVGISALEWGNFLEVVYAPDGHQLGTVRRAMSRLGPTTEQPCRYRVAARYTTGHTTPAATIVS